MLLDFFLSVYEKKTLVALESTSLLVSSRGVSAVKKEKFCFSYFPCIRLFFFFELKLPLSHQAFLVYVSIARASYQYPSIGSVPILPSVSPVQISLRRSTMKEAVLDYSTAFCSIFLLVSFSSAHKTSSLSSQPSTR